MKFLSQTRLRALKKLAILFMWTSLIGAAVTALYYTQQQEHEQPCKKVYVAIYPIDLHFYNRQRVLEVMRKGLGSNQTLLGTGLNEVNVSRLEQELLKEPLIEDAEVYADMEGTLNVRVQQRKPILRILRSDGTQYYLDQYGVKIPLSDYFSCRVPLANGNIFERYEKGDSVYSFVGNELFKIASYVDKHPFYKALIEQIFVRADNELVLVPKIGSRYIVFGSTQEADKKFNKLLVFYREGLSRIGWNKYQSIDVRFEGQVICKK